MPKKTVSMQAVHPLLEAARLARRATYSPYSSFAVGAAVALDDGEVVTGANIENASYGLSCCAERVALFSALHRVRGDKGRLQAIAVTCGDIEGLPQSSLMPCGACRQVMAELLDPIAEVHVDGVGLFLVKDLLPKPFDLEIEKSD